MIIFGWIIIYYNIFLCNSTWFWRKVPLHETLCFIVNKFYKEQTRKLYEISKYNIRNNHLIRFWWSRQWKWCIAISTVGAYLPLQYAGDSRPLCTPSHNMISSIYTFFKSFMCMWKHFTQKNKRKKKVPHMRDKMCLYLYPFAILQTSFYKSFLILRQWSCWLRWALISLECIGRQEIT